MKRIRLSFVLCLSAGGVACGAPSDEIERLEQPISATLLVQGQGAGLAMVGYLPMNDARVIYQGEGDLPVTLEGEEGVYPFSIEHPRYTLWIACPLSEGSRPVIRALAFAAEDTQRPVARCLVDTESAGLPGLFVEMGDTPPDKLAGYAVGPHQSQNHSILGARRTFGTFHASPGPIDMVTTLLSFHGEARQIRLHRDLRVEADRTIEFDFSGHESLEYVALQTTVENSAVSTYLRTENQTRALLLETSSSTVAMLPAGLARSGDVYEVVVEKSDGRRSQSALKSYLIDPSTAKVDPPELIEAFKLLLAQDLDETARLVFPDSDAQVTTAIVATELAFVEVLTTGRWLEGRSSMALRPPEALLPGGKLGDHGDPFGGSLVSIRSNRPTAELLDAEFFAKYQGIPSEYVGLEIEQASVEVDSALIRYE